MGFRKVLLSALSLTLLLASCAPSGTDSVPPSPSPAALQETGASFRDYEDPFYHFQLKTPVWDRESTLPMTLGYGIERGNADDPESGCAVILIAHYNEDQDEGLYDIAYFDTAEDALYELQAGKVDSFFREYYGGSLADAQCTASPCTLDGRAAVRYEGTYTFCSITGEDRPVGVTGYCVLGAETPVLFCVMDLSGGQDQMEELAQVIDQMAGTYADGGPQGD